MKRQEANEVSGDTQLANVVRVSVVSPQTAPGSGQRVMSRTQSDGWIQQTVNQTSDSVRAMSRSLGQFLIPSISQVAQASATTAATGVPRAGRPSPPPSYQDIPGVVPFHEGPNGGPPPSYDDVINPHARPPSYQSLFGRMCEVQRTSCCVFGLIMTLLVILSYLALIALYFILPIAMIWIGASHIDDCRIEHYPAFLLVGGTVWSIKNVHHCLPEGQPKKSIFRLLLDSIMFGWLITGCVIVFRNTEVDYDNPKLAKYCNRTVYLFTFWLISSSLMLFGAVLTCCCCMMIFSAL